MRGYGRVCAGRWAAVLLGVRDERGAGAVLLGPRAVVGCCRMLLPAVKRAGGRREASWGAGRWWLRCELAGRSRRPNKAAAGRSFPKRERAVMQHNPGLGQPRTNAERVGRT